MACSPRTGALAALTGLLLACSPATECPPRRPLPAIPTTPSIAGARRTGTACGAVTALLAGMSTRDKLAQLLMVGVTGADDARAVVDTHHVGGIMIGSWTDLSMMGDDHCADIAARRGPAAAGGQRRRGGRTGVAPGRPDRQLSRRRGCSRQTKTPAEVRGIAFQRGQAMRSLGITIDFAPVVDVTTESDDEVIGDRSFGSDPAQVVEFAGAYAQGLRDAGVLPVLKHFPGHGHASGDSHQGGVVTPPLADLQANDLVPYRTLTTQAPVAVMVGHMQVPGLTGSDPASLSPAAYGLLRSGGYGGPAFGGLVFTDDLSSMGAINQRYGVADAVLRALQAGADVALWVTTDEVPAVLDRLEKALAAGELTQPRVDDSVLRVAGSKGPNPRC